MTSCNPSRNLMYYAVRYYMYPNRDIIVSRRLSLVFLGDVNFICDWVPSQSDTIYIIPHPQNKIKKKTQSKLNQIQQTYTKKQQTNIETKNPTTTWKFVKLCVLIKVFKQKLYIEEVELSLNAVKCRMKSSKDKHWCSIKYRTYSQFLVETKCLTI